MKNNLGIYIHIPFCVKKCDYCDFLSAPFDINTRSRYVEALKTEIKLHKEILSEYLVDTVFIGGGTPSILEGEQIFSIIETLKSVCNLKKGAEITIECNPGTVTEQKFKSYKNVGINRLSFGLQSANNDELKLIGRIHTYEDFLESFSLARKCGFNNINVDLMSALPKQKVDSYLETLRKVVALEPEHISAYSLIVEDDTALKKRVEKEAQFGKSILPSEDEERNMYYLTKDMLENYGYMRYEISNYAKHGFECQHNIGYWKRKEYLGFGIGAASLIKETRYSNIRDINQYIEILLGDKGNINKKGNICYNKLGAYVTDKGNINKKENICTKEKNEKIEISILHQLQKNREKISIEEQMAEMMFLGLRMMQGICCADFEKKFGKSMEETYSEILEKLIRQGLLEKQNGFIKLTTKGIDISNYVMSEFV